MQWSPPTSTEKLVASNDGNIMRYIPPLYLPSPATAPAPAPVPLCRRLRSGTRAALPRLIACHFNKPFFQLASLEREGKRKGERERERSEGVLAVRKASKCNAKMRIVYAKKPNDCEQLQLGQVGH